MAGKAAGVNAEQSEAARVRGFSDRQSHIMCAPCNIII